ncbi:MAG: EamA family transporter [Gemmatimonadaceae bacterium]
MSSPVRVPRPAPAPPPRTPSRAPTADGAPHAAPRSQVLAAFAAVYVIWGSTYLAIRFAIETLPPLLMAGARFTVAGALLYAWTRRPGATERPPRPTATEWGWGALVGGLLLLGGNGAVVWAEKSVPSGVVALLVAAVPVWMVLLDWARPGGRRPGPLVIAGLLTGFAGLVALVGLGSFSGGLSGGAGAVSIGGALVALFGSLTWAIGSIISRGAGLPRSPFLATAIEMLCGGVLLLVAGLVAGEGGGLALAHVAPRSALAWMYLVVFGSLVGFTAYVWLLGHVSAARASTYAYVNPVVAVLLGWALAGEPITARTLVSAAVIVGAVALITIGRDRG